MSFANYVEIGIILACVGIGGLGYYLKRRGVLRAAANAAAAAVAQDVQNVADKITK